MFRDHPKRVDTRVIIRFALIFYCLFFTPFSWGKPCLDRWIGLVAPNGTRLHLLATSHTVAASGGCTLHADIATAVAQADVVAFEYIPAANIGAEPNANLPTTHVYDERLAELVARAWSSLTGSTRIPEAFRQQSFAGQALQILAMQDFKQARIRGRSASNQPPVVGDTIASIDAQIKRLVQSLGKPTAGLEEKFLGGVFDIAPVDAQREFLEAAANFVLCDPCIKNVESRRRLQLEIQQQQGLKAYEQSVVNTQSEYGFGFIGKWIGEYRNRGFAEAIQTLSKQHKKIVVVVGASHVIGPNSIIDLLQKDGFLILN